MPWLLNNRCLNGILTRLVEWTEVYNNTASITRWTEAYKAWALDRENLQENLAALPFPFYFSRFFLVSRKSSRYPSATPPLPHHCLVAAGSHHHLVLGDGSSAAFTSPAIASLEQRASGLATAPPLQGATTTSSCAKAQAQLPPHLLVHRLWSEEQAVAVGGGCWQWLLAVAFGGKCRSQPHIGAEASRRTAVAQVGERRVEYDG
ncbi:hypothetical protein LR48_Vigan10g182600 [Vigna angularis]|uniref:Uncharacterized protein n=1 Tax=Phaseolus angularis TaxID=3914 RepID=A0A0L9VMH1_PHAAN|nr:hypothetical protein LR48_Vigan10g182600 [Vigna angularis]